MSELIKTSITREEAMRVFHQDGIIEIIAGAVLLNFGFDLLNQAGITSLFTYIPVILYSSMKSQITLSRLGYDSFNGNEKKVRMWNLAIAAGLVVMLTLMSMTVLGDPLHIRSSLTLPFGGNVGNLFNGLFMALGCLAAGYLIPLKRFYAYAPVPVVLCLLSFFFLPADKPLSLALPVFLCALGILVPGIILMVKFTRAYPVTQVKK
jgi:hypothetical protein